MARRRCLQRWKLTKRALEPSSSAVSECLVKAPGPYHASVKEGRRTRARATATPRTHLINTNTCCSHRLYLRSCRHEVWCCKALRSSWPLLSEHPY